MRGSIINVHGHLLTDKDYPKKFPNGILGAIGGSKVGDKVLSFMLENVNPFTDKDSLDRLNTMKDAGKIGNVQDMFYEWSKHYPKDTKFVVLAMNMWHMGAGKCRRSYLDYLLKLNRLKEEDSRVLPFYAIDARDSNLDRYFDEFVIKRNWPGVKAYPPLGTFPQDQRYDKIYSALAALNKPLISHCTYSNPVHYQGPKRNLKVLLAMAHDISLAYDKKLSRKENCNKFTDPRNWGIVSMKHPELRIGLGHMGGSDAIIEWAENPLDKSNQFGIILDLMKKHKNIYADFSYSGNKETVIDVIYHIMTDPSYAYLQDRVMFGSDWSMNLSEVNESHWAFKIPRMLGAEVFNKVAVENTHKFIYG